VAWASVTHAVGVGVAAGGAGQDGADHAGGGDGASAGLPQPLAQVEGEVKDQPGLAGGFAAVRVGPARVSARRERREVVVEGMLGGVVWRRGCEVQ